MKKLLLAILLFVSLHSFSQEITVTRGRFYADNKELSNREVKNMLASNLPALKQFKNGKSNQSLGGLFIGLGTAFCVADLVKGLVSDEKYPSGATYIGIGCFAVSVPILIGNKKRISNAINLYNEGLKSTGENSTEYKLSIISNNNGCGIQFQF